MPGARVKFRMESRAVEALAKKLSELNKKVAKKALKKGVNDITKVVMWTARSLVPKRSRQLYKALGRKIVTYRGGAIVAGVIGPRKGFRVLWRGKYIDPTKYAHLVEYGRREVVAGKAKGKSTGKKVLADGVKGTSGLPGVGTIYGKRVRSVPPRPFMRPAWEQNKNRAVGILINHLRKGIREHYRNAGLI